MTHSQYNNTVRDLLGDRTAPATQFPAEDFVNGFKNQYQAQNLSPLLVEAYGTAAERLARNAFRPGIAQRFTHLQAVRRVPDAVHSEASDLKAFRTTARTRSNSKRYEALFVKEKDFTERRPAGGRGDAAVAALPVPAGGDKQSALEALRSCEPPLVRAVGHDSG